MASSRNNLHVVWRIFCLEIVLVLFWLWELSEDHVTFPNSVVLSIFFYSDDYPWFCTFKKGYF